MTLPSPLRIIRGRSAATSEARRASRHRHPCARWEPDHAVVAAHLERRLAAARSATRRTG